MARLKAKNVSKALKKVLRKDAGGSLRLSKVQRKVLKRLSKKHSSVDEQQVAGLIKEVLTSSSEFMFDGKRASLGQAAAAAAGAATHQKHQQQQRHKAKRERGSKSEKNKHTGKVRVKSEQQQEQPSEFIIDGKRASLGQAAAAAAGAATYQEQQQKQKYKTKKERGSKHEKHKHAGKVKVKSEQQQEQPSEFIIDGKRASLGQAAAAAAGAATYQEQQQKQKYKTKKERGSKHEKSKHTGEVKVKYEQQQEQPGVDQPQKQEQQQQSHTQQQRDGQQNNLRLHGDAAQRQLKKRHKHQDNGQEMGAWQQQPEPKKARKQQHQQAQAAVVTAAAAAVQPAGQQHTAADAGAEHRKPSCSKQQQQQLPAAAHPAVQQQQQQKASTFKDLINKASQQSQQKQKQQQQQGVNSRQLRQKQAEQQQQQQAPSGANQQQQQQQQKPVSKRGVSRHSVINEETIAAAAAQGLADEDGPAFSRGGGDSWRADYNRRDVKHGRFSDAEKAAIDAAIKEYAEQRGLTHGKGNCEWLLERQATQQKRGAMTAIAAALPHRTRKAVWQFVRANYCSVEITAPFTPCEDQRLLRLYQELGPCWKEIGQRLGRRELACRDRARELNYGQPKTTGRWSQDEVDALQSAVLSYKQAVAAGAAARKTLSQNLLPADHEPREQAVVSLDNIDWTWVAAAVGGRTAKQCSEKYYDRLAPSMIESGQWGKGDDKRLIQALEAAAKQEEYQVDWDSLLESRTAEQCKRRWRLIQKFLPVHVRGDFAAAVKDAASRVKGTKQKAKDREAAAAAPPPPQPAAAAAAGGKHGKRKGSLGRKGASADRVDDSNEQQQQQRQEATKR